MGHVVSSMADTSLPICLMTRKRGHRVDISHEVSL